MTKDGWPVPHPRLTSRPSARRITCRPGSHGESIDLGLDVDCLDGVLLQPSDIDFNVKVTDAAGKDQP